MARIIDARVRQKAATLEEWNNSDLDSLDGEQLFVRSDVDDKVIGFKLGAKNKKFSELDYPDFTVRGKVSPTSTWVGRQSGVYIPTLNGVYNGIEVNLADGYQVLYWDGNTIEKVVYPSDYSGAVFGGAIDDTKDLSTPPTEPTWYIASPGDYNTTPAITLTENSILSWDGNEWSHIPFELEVRGEFLVADNIAEVRNITPEVAQLLVNGTYKGVEVLGYYEKGDTPAPIIYYLSDTAEEDDGGSVIVVGDIKLEHYFNGYVNILYFGAKLDNTTDDTIQAQKALDYLSSLGGGTLVWNGKSIITDTLYLNSNNITVKADSKVINQITFRKSNASVFRNGTSGSIYHIVFENISINSLVSYDGVKGFDFSGISYSVTRQCSATLRGENTSGNYVEHAESRGSYYNTHYDFVFSGNRDSSIGYEWGFPTGGSVPNRGVNATRVFGGRISVCKIGVQLKGNDNLFCGITFESLKTTEGSAFEIGDSSVASSGAGNTIIACAMESGFNFIWAASTTGVNYELGSSATGMGSGGLFMAGDASTKIMRLTGGAAGMYFPLSAASSAEFGGNVLIKTATRRFINRDTTPSFVMEGLSGTTPDIDVHVVGRVSGAYAGGFRLLPIGGTSFYPLQFFRANGAMTLVQEDTVTTTPVYSQRIMASGRATPNGFVSAPQGSICQTSNGKLWIKESGTGSSGWAELVSSSLIATTTTKGLVNQGVHVPNGSSVDTLLSSLRAAGIIASS